MQLLHLLRPLAIMAILCSCVPTAHFPGPSGLSLNADNEFEWVGRVNYRSGTVLLTFEVEEQHCGSELDIFFSNDKENRITHEALLYLWGFNCSGTLGARAAHFNTPHTSLSTYADEPIPYQKTNKVEISWVGRQRLIMTVNGVKLVDAPLGRTFHYMRLKAPSGAIRIVDLSYE